jgi:hypothetical protein
VTTGINPQIIFSSSSSSSSSIVTSVVSGLVEFPELNPLRAHGQTAEQLVQSKFTARLQDKQVS